MTGRQLAITGKGTGNQQNNARANSLASGAEQMFSGSLKNWVARTDEAAQITKQGLEVVFNRC